MIVLLYAVGCVVVGFLVGFIVMQMDKSKARKRKQSIDGDNIENKVSVKWKLLHIKNQLNRLKRFYSLYFSLAFRWIRRRVL